MEIFHLNAQQQQAVDTLEGPLLLLAGAGTGKTRVIVQRIVNLIRHGVSGNQILAVTFTNKAAREMKSRVGKALPELGEKALPTVSTFHSFCASVLRQHATYIGYTRNFSFATEGYQNGLLREVAIETGNAGSNVDPYGWLAVISRAKSAMVTPEELAESEPKIAAIYKRYDERLRQINMMDFDDILLRTVELWKARPDVLEAYRDRYRYLMIDEYQDTNRVQLEIMVQLAGTRANICAVGDDDQSIYGWRGADQRNILDYEKYFPEAKLIRLEQNYRSTNCILKASNAVIAKNRARRPKALWSEHGEGEKLLAVRCADSEGESRFIAEEIYERASGGRVLVSSLYFPWKDYAVLYRTGAQSRQLEEAFRKRHIPYAIVGSKSFYQRKEILDLMAMLELAVNPRNDMALVRVVNVPPRGVGDGALAKLSELRDATGQPMFSLLQDGDYTSRLPAETVKNLEIFSAAISRVASVAHQPGAIAPVVQRLVQELQYMEKLLLMYKPRTDALERQENIQEFLHGVEQYDLEKQNRSNLQEYLQMLAMQDMTDRVDKEKNVTENAVSLMTIHAAKGLEFPVVFVAGMEQGLFPHQMALDEGGVEEERRLCYVAMTRAKKELILTYAEKRNVKGALSMRRPSMFLNEIPRDMMVCATPAELRKPLAEAEADKLIEAFLAKLESEDSPEP